LKLVFTRVPCKRSL